MKLILQPGDYIQIFISFLTLAAIIVNVVVFAIQRSTDRKREAVKVGLNIEHLVIRWAYIDMVLYNINKKTYAILSNADISKMNLFESNEIPLVYTSDEISAVKALFADNYSNPMLSTSPSIIFNVPKEIIYKANAVYPTVFKEVIGHSRPSSSDDILYSFNRILLDTLNRMETLCVMIDKEIADEDTVYATSGYQFIRFVKILHYYISYINSSKIIEEYGESRKVMKHVIKAFDKWKDYTKQIKA